MSSIEKKVVDAVLARIRARRNDPSAAAGDQGARSSSPLAPSKLREARFTDFEPVHDLKHRWGLIPDSFDNWERLWRLNPALKYFHHSLPIGWVLEADGRVVGYLGNVPSNYTYGDRTLNAVTGHGLVVEPAYRMVSVSLMAAFFRQKSVDLYLTTTAVAAVGKIARMFKADPLPQPDYGVLFWVLRPRPFAQHVMEKLRLRSPFSAAGAALASLTVGADRLLRRRWPRQRSTSLQLRELAPDAIGDDFQFLWKRKLAEGPRLFADRSPAALRWHFETPGDRGTTRLICCYRTRELVGYVVVRDDPGQMEGLRRSLIADLLVDRDDPEILTALFVAAHQHADRAGSHILELLGFPRNVRQVCMQWSPYSRKYPACPFYYKAADPVLHRALADGAAWYASPFDGDTTLMPLLGAPESEMATVHANARSPVPAGDRSGAD